MIRTPTPEEFTRNVAGHQMTVLRDDGLYRHLRFSKPTTRNMSFDILTWPGYLAFVGDMGDNVFARIPDMLEFFRGDSINPRYWAEKVQACDRNGIEEYREEKAREWVEERLKDASEKARLAADGITFDEGPDEVYRQLRDFDTSELDDEDPFSGWEEADFTEYTHHYIWCCFALVWAIKVYDAQVKPAPTLEYASPQG